LLLDLPLLLEYLLELFGFRELPRLDAFTICVEKVVVLIHFLDVVLDIERPEVLSFTLIRLLIFIHSKAQDALKHVRAQLLHVLLVQLLLELLQSLIPVLIVHPDVLLSLLQLDAVIEFLAQFLFAHNLR
jgi:hypothetical protein